MKKKEIIARVRMNTGTKQKVITIPKEAVRIKEGDWVSIRKVKFE